MADSSKQQDHSKLGINESLDDTDGRYLKGHEGYKRWYGTPRSRSRSKSRSRSPSPAKHMSADGKYLKGHAGYEKSYGDPGAPNPATSTDKDKPTQSSQNRISRSLDKSPKLPKTSGGDLKK